MTYRRRISLLLLMDSLIVLSAVFFSYFFVNASFSVITLSSVISSITLLVSHHLFAFVYKLYKKALEYASIGELLIICKVVTFSILTTAVVQQIIMQKMYFRLLVVTWMIHILLIGGSRFIWRMYTDIYYVKKGDKKRTLIVGAGSAGTMVARQLLKNNTAELMPVAFIDDNVKKHNLDIWGIPVIGGMNQIDYVIKKLNIEIVILAIPSLNKRERNVILKDCLKTKVKTQILPMLEDLVTGKVSVNEFRDVQVEDLLGRDPVELDVEIISDYITDKVILVTGAGGSIGSEICRQVAKFKPKKLILLGHGENSIYSIEMELNEKYNDMRGVFIPEIADIQDEKKMHLIMNKHLPNVVYHAAAHKHVPLMENNPEEAVKNNLIGTMNIAEAARTHGVGTFVMISSDKAVNPTSVMGATKKLAEMVIQHKDKISHTKFVTVRFGNVLGSRGSVIPLFKKQIQNGGPITVTHPDMVRYFMTIPEASRLVVQAGALAKGGEIFVLDMGEPVKIVDLAKNLIRLSGNSLDEIGIEFTGIRPGEKLFEELLKEDEMNEKQVHPRIYVGQEMNVRIEEIEKLILEYTELDEMELRKRLLNLVNQRKTLKLLIPVSG
ncbi:MULTISPECIES: polysaccharide biosynthesis protein [Bacillus cereus group]|uniref:polysaccharide biosynthesis protein n=1 Tax=Bacillus cereus group TaxID=86661 RepID=UPI000872F94E|nr:MULTISPECIES: nucleoside-diphosphate sugar epimerase/dehydratase [Bacillus cereus group]OFC98276.1 UDP-N-acetylglucosamine 4,6-dehydratase [Bacillus thuringiensis]MBJ8046914.1 polysaccharide biosynthesis protein [Bacillus cereus group sp. N18]OFD07153.1 UDP-N-acetylglucosamine 4,6-dehydratase [Bacillus thuringiensis]PDZ85793.1 polysaccharide biosynthesis protein [Bacillus toyonensis]PEA70898.1 polysaccharide biosynthesis protein [Bacillus toyonensis]